MFSREDFDEEVQNIVEQLVRAYRPQKVILFGSLARGEASQETDIDLFIVKSDVPYLGVDRIRPLDELIRYRVAMDFVVYTPAEVDQRLKLGDPFVRNVFEQGKVLYDAA